MLKFSKGKWNKNGGVIVAGNGTQIDNDIVYKSVCTMHGTGFKKPSLEREDNQKLICMAPDMYRTLYAQYMLGWKIFKIETSVGFIWVFEAPATVENPTGFLGQTKVNGDFPIWNEDLISGFDKAVEKGQK